MTELQHPVLVVDDETDILDLMEMTLMKMGLRVHTASGVAEAKNKLDSQHYSLVLTDMRMPDGSGLEVVQHINSRLLDTPVAVITAFGNADQAQEALRCGAFDPDTMQIQDYLDQIERDIIEQTLKQTEGNRTQAAKRLGISFRSMRYRMERLNIG
ncbi:TPA: response regulator [Neisseria meningitidis]